MIFRSFEEEIKEMHLNMYKYVLEGKQSYFPSAFWENGEGNVETFKTFLLYYIHEVLEYPEGEIPYEKITKELIKQSRLGVAYKALFDNRLENMFKEVFPEVYPYGMPLMPDELWEGKGYWEGHTPLEETFPKWYLVEHLGLNEDNVVGLIPLVVYEDDDRYRRITRYKYRGGLAEVINRAFPNKDITVIKKGIKGRASSLVALKKRLKENPNAHLLEKLKIFSSDKNCYSTNSGCNIHMYTEDGFRKIRILNYDRPPLEREVTFIQQYLLGAVDPMYLNIEKNGNEVLIIENNLVNLL